MANASGSNETVPPTCLLQQAPLQRTTLAKSGTYFALPLWLGRSEKHDTVASYSYVRNSVLYIISGSNVASFDEGWVTYRRDD